MFPVTMSPVVMAREMRRRGLEAWRVWVGYLSLGGTASFAELCSALAGAGALQPREVYLLTQALNF